MMHAIIAHQVGKYFEVEDLNSFIIGGIAADANLTDKDTSHFYKGSMDDFSKVIEIDRFTEKYKHQIDHPFILGYYTHLIADDNWLNGFALSWLKNRLDHDDEIFYRYHNDFQVLNGKLLKHYNLKETLKDIFDEAVLETHVDEVKTEDIRTFISYIIKDIDYQEPDLYEDLQVFSFDQLLGYLETCIQKSILKINQNNFLMSSKS